MVLVIAPRHFNEHARILMLHTSLFLKANMTAPACSAAFPTIGIKIMLMKLTDSSQDADAACKICSDKHC
jgi:hypothetical protein